MEIKQFQTQVSNPNILDPTCYWDGTIDNVSITTSYRNVLLFIKKMEDYIFYKKEVSIQYVAGVLNYDGEITPNKVMFIYNVLMGDAFTYPEKEEVDHLYENKDITYEEYIEIIKMQRYFSHYDDFDIIWAIFNERFGIDLEKDDISWFKYKRYIEMLMLEDTNALKNRIKIRSFKPQTNDKNGTYTESNKAGIKLKKKYALFPFDEGVIE